MPLTDTAIRKAKPKSKPYKLSDSNGLYLLVSPNNDKPTWIAAREALLQQLKRLPRFLLINPQMIRRQLPFSKLTENAIRKFLKRCCERSMG